MEIRNNALRKEKQNKEKIKLEQKKKLERENEEMAIIERIVEHRIKSKQMRTKDKIEREHIDILTKFVTSQGLDLSYGQRVHECVAWWLAGVIEGEDIIDAFNNYLADNLT